MTLSERNTFFKAGIIFCSLCTLLILAVSFLTIPLYQETASGLEEITSRPARFFLGNSYFAVHVSLSVLVLFSLLGIILIHAFFERTSAPEILYISLFTITLAFEVIRQIIPLFLIFNFSSFYVRIALRVLLFARFFGIFSLFAASICAAGLEVQKTRNVIFILIIASLTITMSVPIDALNWDTSFNMINGYISMFRMIEFVSFVTTIISFLIASRNRGAKEYNYIALGVLLALIGRNILLYADNWAGPIPGILLLSIGTWFICSKLHRIHLWL